MKSKTLISRPILLVLLLVFTSGLTHLNAQTDMINLQRRDVNLLIDNIQYQTSLNQNLKNGFDSVRHYYNDAVDTINALVARLQACINDRDRAMRKIDTLRGDVSKAWVEKDMAVAQMQVEHNKKNEAFDVGVDLVGYNPFMRTWYTGVSLHWSPKWAHFSLRGLISNQTAPGTYSTNVYDKIRTQ